MADLIAVANGNLTSSSTWATVDSTSKLDSEAGNTVLTTSNVDSSAFTPGAITIDGVAVKLLNRASSPSGTITMTLRNSTGSVDVASVTINISDIPSDSVTNNNGGWVFFNIGSTLLIAATNYTIRLKTSASSQISAYRDATAGNWSRMLRTTTTAAPGAGDQMLICGEWTAAATQTTRTVTMDSTSLATSYGNLNVCLGGTLTWGTTASTNYQLSLAGLLNLYGGGTYNMGTVGTPMPSTSSGVLEFNCGSNVQYGMELYGGTCIIQGNAITNVSAKLAADASAAATSLTTDISTGWKNGDLIGLAPTTATSTQFESKSLTADASGTTLTISAITNAHGGNSTTGVQGELVNLTRNVKIRGVSTTNQAYINIREACTVNWDYVEIYQMGSATTNKRGIDITLTATDSNSISINACVLRDFVATLSIGFNMNAPTSALVFTNNNTYNIHTSHIQTSATTVTSDISGNICIGSSNSGGSILNLNDAGITCSTVRVSGCANTNGAININESTGFITQLGDIVTHSNAGQGINIGNIIGGNITSITSWRNTSSGIAIGNNNGTLTSIMTLGVLNIGTITVFGNSNGVSTTGTVQDLVIGNFVADAGATITQSRGLITNSASHIKMVVEKGSFGATNTHSLGDVVPSGSFDLTFRKTVFASSTEWNGFPSGSSGSSVIKSQDHDGTAGNHKTQYDQGLITIDTTIYDTTPSQRLTPNSNSSSSRKLKSAPIRIPVASGQTLTPSVKVRTSVVGDGAAYNGNRARLVLARNEPLGITSDTVLATASAASDGAWETLSGTTSAAAEDGVMIFYVDCDGSAGWINVDTATIT